MESEYEGREEFLETMNGELEVDEMNADYANDYMLHIVCPKIKAVDCTPITEEFYPEMYKALDETQFWGYITLHMTKGMLRFKAYGLRSNREYVELNMNMFGKPRIDTTQ